MASTIKIVARRVNHVLWRATLWILGGIAVVVPALLLSLNLHPLREFVRVRVNQALADLLVGHLEVDRIGHINIDGVRGVDAHLLDERGQRVVSLAGLSVRSNWPEIVRSLVFSKPLDIRLIPLEVEHMELVVLADADGAPSVLRALTPKPSKSPADTSPASTTLSIQRIRLGHCWAHGSLPSVPVIDSELIGLTGAFVSTPNGLSGTIQRVQLVSRGLPTGLGISGVINGQIQVPAQASQPMRGFAEFRGDFDASNVVARADIQGNKLTGELRAPAIPATLLRRFAPGAKVSQPTALDAHVQGDLPNLDFTANVVNADTSLSVSGKAVAVSDADLHVDVALKNLDLATWVNGVPATRISSDLHADLTMTAGGQWFGGYRIVAPRGKFGSTETPAIFGDGTLKRTPNGAFDVEGQLRVAEPGASLHTVFSIALPIDSAPRITAKLAGEIAKPPRLSAMTGLVVSGDLNATADIDLELRRLSVDAVARLSPVLHSHARIHRARLRATVTGDLAAPDLKLFADVENIAVNGRVIHRLAAEANGTLDSMQVSGTAETDRRQQLTLSSRVSIGQRLSVEQPNLAIDDQEGRVSIAAQRVSIAPDQIRVEHAEITGLGEVQGSASIRGTAVEGELHARELDLARLAHLVGVRQVDRGLLNLDATIAGSLRDPSGKVRGRVRQLAIGEIKDGQVDLELDLADHHVNATVDGAWGDSKLRLSAVELDVANSSALEDLLRGMRGEVTLDAQIVLAQWAPMLRTLGAPIENLSGRMQLLVNARRSPDDAAPMVIQGRVTTDGLRVVELRKQPGSTDSSSEASAARPRVIEGIDCDMQLDLDPARGQANLQARLFDRLGPLVMVQAASQLPPLAGAAWRIQSETLPVHAALRVPERVLQKLPSFIRPAAMRGVVSAFVEVDGTLQQPHLRGQVVVSRLQSREGKYSVDAEIEANYEARGGQVEGHARSTRGGTALLVTNWNGDLIGRIRQGNSSEGSPFDLRSHVAFKQFPLAIVPALSDREIRGPLTGSVELSGLGKDANLRIRLDGSGMTINRVPLPHFNLLFSADDRELHASVDTGQGVGSVRADVRAGSRWGTRWIPEPTSAASLRLLARRFQIAVLAPFVARYLSTLEGLLDADFSGTLEPRAPRIEGHAELTDGVIQIPQVGQRFSDVKARIVATNNEIRLESMEARGISGRMTAEGRALLDGASIRSANARVDIKEKEKLPVTLEGVMMGDAWGNAELSYRQEGEKTEIRVDVPRFRLKMPDAAQNSVQELEPADDVRIGAHRADGTFVAMPTQPLRKTTPDEGKSPSSTHVSIHLGDSVWIERGRQVSVQVAGQIEIKSDEQQKLDGRIELRTGKLDVSGKEFHIERGVVTFDEGEASNPTITATARWDSPVGYVVYADYSGTVKDGKLKLHAEPNLSEDEILSLLLFGSPEGSIASSGGAGTTGALGSSSGSSGSNPGGNRSGGSTGSGSAGAAVSVAGGTATKGLNRAISDVTNLDVSTRIDTSTGSSRPELVVQLTPRLTTRVTRALGEPTPGQSPDRTFLTLELRLKRAWSASAMVGDHGASTFDLIWRKRY